MWERFEAGSEAFNNWAKRDETFSSFITATTEYLEKRFEVFSQEPIVHFEVLITEGCPKIELKEQSIETRKFQVYLNTFLQFFLKMRR